MIRLLGDLWATGYREIELDDSISCQPSAAIANLETPVISNNALATQRRKKAGPHIRGHVEALGLISATFPYLKCLSLANNHVMDFGPPGLYETIEMCKKLDIETVGASHDIRSASSSYIFNVDGLKVGVLSRCEAQFGVSSHCRAGVAPFDVTIHSSIRQLKSKVDVVVVSVHAAAELSPWPSPSWQDQLRALVDVGADIVHGHHSHVPQGYERYNEGLIAYGLGNGLTVPSQWTRKNTDWSLIFDISIENGTIISNVRVCKLIECTDTNKVTLNIKNIDTSSTYHDYIEKCNEPLHDRTLLEGLWQEASLRMYDAWYAEWLCTSPLVNRYSRRTRWAIKSGLKQLMRMLGKEERYPPKSFLTYLLFACESHREVIKTSLGVLSGELDDKRSEKTRAMADIMMSWSRRY